MKNMIGIIGGSGFYKFLDSPSTEKVNTPFGKVEFDIGTKGDENVCFIPRHGRSHSILPGNINYRANIFGAWKLGVDFILATNAVGSLDQKIEPGTFAVPNQILDFTHGRISTFFDGSDFEVTTHSGKKLEGVVHTDVSEPFNQSIRSKILKAAEQNSIEMIDGGTIVVANGPRYETPAEIKAYRILGADYVGMTSSPEAFLAKELEIPYATVCVITNYAAGMQSSLSHKEVERIFDQNITPIKSIFSTAITTDS